ncbi:MAG: hypothetical protein ACYCYN_05065, partial [Solirubrobacteraceae bacterium]
MFYCVQAWTWTASGRRFGRVLAATLGALAALGWVAGTARAQTTTTTTYATPGSYIFTVPAGVSSLTVTAVGAAGGACNATSGGEGASGTVTVTVSSGQELAVGVGGPGGGCQFFNTGVPAQADGGGGAGG